MFRIVVTRKAALLVAIGIALGASTVAMAVDQSRINMARASLAKASALIQAAGSDRAGHAAKAIADINDAMGELNSMGGG